MESIASTRRVASRVWLEGMASAAVRPCAEAQRRSGTGISHGCERPSCAETQRGNGTGLAWVRASVLRESAAGQWYRSRMGAGVYPCAESLRGSGTGISHGCERSPLRRIAAGQRYRHFAWVRTSTLARRRSGAMVLASRMGASVRPCAEALWGSGTVISHGCERPSCAKAQRRNGTGISHGCERPSCAETQRGNGTGISHGCGRSSCAKALRRNGVGISHGCERLPLARRRRIPVLCRRPRCALSGGDIPLPEVCARRCLEGRGVLGRSLEIYATEQRRNICQFARSSMARKRTDPSACGAPTPANSSPT